MAGSKEKLSLKWNSFEENLSNAYRELREGGDFCDVTLACEDKQVEAHKVVLAANSLFFQSILKRNKHEHPLLYLKGVKYDDLVSILDFIYKGEVSITEEELNSFLAVAEDLQVKGLTDKNGNNKPGPTMNMQSEPARPKATRTNSSLLPRPQLLDLELDLQAQVLPEPLILKSEKQLELVGCPVACSTHKSQVVGVDQGGFGTDETIIGGVATSDEMDRKNRVVKKVITDDTYGEYFDSRPNIVRHVSSNECVANGDDGVLCCKYCFKIYLSRKCYLKHLKMHGI